MNHIAPILKQLFAAYPNNHATEGTVAIYLRLLADIDPADLQTCVDQAIAECKFLPTVAELRERYHLLTRTLNQLAPAEAWGLVQAELKRVGSWGSPKFDDPLVAQVVRSMGWINLCQSDQPGVDRAQFMRMYEQIMGRREQIDRLLPQARELLEDSAQRSGPKRLADLLRNAQVAQPEAEKSR